MIISDKLKLNFLSLIAFCLIFLLPTNSIAQSLHSWKYETSTDSLTSKKIYAATLTSENSLDLQFPYEGFNFGKLIVREHPTYGKDVIFRLQKGQIFCTANNCKIKIRFDNDNVETFTVNESSEGSANVVFAKYPEWAINKLRSAKKIIIHFPIYQNGSQTFEFQSNSPLQWPMGKTDRASDKYHTVEISAEVYVRSDPETTIRYIKGLDILAVDIEKELNPTGNERISIECKGDFPDGVMRNEYYSHYTNEPVVNPEFKIGNKTTLLDLCNQTEDLMRKLKPDLYK